MKHCFSDCRSKVQLLHQTALIHGMVMIMKYGLDSQPLLVSLLMEGEDLMGEEKLGGKLAVYVYLLIVKV